jgi:hypothetical protein
MSPFIFTKKILAGEPIDVFNSGQHSRDFTYIDDIVEGVVRILDRVAAPNPDWSGDDPDPASSTAPYRLYNIGNNQPVDLMDFIKCIEMALGKVAQKNMLPLQPGDVQATYADVDALVAEINFKPQTPIEVGIRRFIDWYKVYYGGRVVGGSSAIHAMIYMRGQAAVEAVSSRFHRRRRWLGRLRARQSAEPRSQQPCSRRRGWRPRQLDLVPHSRCYLYAIGNPRADWMFKTAPEPNLGGARSPIRAWRQARSARRSSWSFRALARRIDSRRSARRSSTPCRESAKTGRIICS